MTRFITLTIMLLLGGTMLGLSRKLRATKYELLDWPLLIIGIVIMMVTITPVINYASTLAGN